MPFGVLSGVGREMDVLDTIINSNRLEQIFRCTRTVTLEKYGTVGSNLDLRACDQYSVYYYLSFARDLTQLMDTSNVVNECYAHVNSQRILFFCRSINDITMYQIHVQADQSVVEKSI